MPRMRDAAAALGVPEAALVEARRGDRRRPPAPPPRRPGRLRRHPRPSARGRRGHGAHPQRGLRPREARALQPARLRGRHGPGGGRDRPPPLPPPVALRLPPRRGHPLRPAPQPAVLRRQRHRHPQGLRNPRHRRRRLRPHRRRLRRPRRAARRLRAGSPPPSARTPRSTWRASAPPGRRRSTPTSSSCSCAASASPAPRPCASPPTSPARSRRRRPPLLAAVAASAPDHGLRRQPRLRADPLGAGPPHRGCRPVAERPRPPVQPPPPPGSRRLRPPSCASPRSIGDIHALELFDAAGEIAVQFFGTRPPQGERPEWRALVTGLAAGLNRRRPRTSHCGLRERAISSNLARKRRSGLCRRGALRSARCGQDAHIPPCHSRIPIWFLCIPDAAGPVRRVNDLQNRMMSGTSLDTFSPYYQRLIAALTRG